MVSEINNSTKTSNLSLARLNSLAYKNHTRSTQIEASDGKTVATKSDLAKLVAKIDGLGSSRQVTSVRSKAQVLSLFHPDFDANTLTSSQRDALRAARYLEESNSINFSNLQAKDIDKLEAMNKALDTLKDDDSDKDSTALIKELGIAGLFV
jgi:hypothetical protein